MSIRITEDHKYFNEQNIEYQGVTSLVSLYKTPFDKQKAAENYARKNGNTPQYWIELWDKNRDTACDRGHIFHEYKEQGTLGRGVDVINGAIRMVRNQNLYKAKSLFDLPDGLYTELKLWDDGYRLAGTADKVNIETKGSYRYIDLDDYKTNGKITTQSYQFPDGSFKMMLYPVAHLMDCTLIHYELQLSFYMFVLERHGFTPRNMRITHYPPEIEENNKIHRVVRRRIEIPYELVYRKREIIAILNHFTKQKRQHEYNKVR